MKVYLESRKSWTALQYRAKRLSDRPVQHTLIHWNTAYGQSDYTLFAHSPDKQTTYGRLTFSTFRNNTHVNMLEVYPEHRRKGIGSGLMKELHFRHKHELHEKPGKIHYGYASEEGAAMLASKKVPFGKKA